MRAVAAGLVMLAMATGCGSTPTPVTPPVATRTPVRSAADLHCSLPVVTAKRAGFIDFPSGAYRADAQAPPPDQNFGLAYSPGAHRWVATSYSFGYQLLSPDGLHFVEVQGPPMYSGQAGSSNELVSDIYLVDVNTYARKKVGSVPGRARVIAYRADGIYLDAGSVLRFNPATGTSTRITPNPSLPSDFVGWFWLTRSTAWSSLIAGPNQLDQNPVLSMSLTDGSLTTWYRAPATRSVSIVGFVTPDEPLVVEYNREPYDKMTGVKFMLLTAPGSVESLNIDASMSAWGVTEAFGVWLESPGHVWLYDSAGLIPMADTSRALDSSVPGVVGPCAPAT